jgi:hypothetical protein
MSVMSNLAYEIEQLYIEGMHPTKIAKEVGCPLSMVYDWLESMDVECDDSMDGDAATALASAGLGTDEDYGDYGGDSDYM